ncbi:prolyl oligopeptidase family serine peptidase [Microbacterium sediminicola]|uniref:Prolyl oligopeptidase family serine peptidase n=1 Tax=Microbacterium sediminicola TaxID=415210 RepID=A0ABP4U197_9MICO
MSAPTPYGAWPSPVTAAVVSRSPARIDGACFVDDEIWWGQTVAAEAGRTAVLRRGADGSIQTLLPAPWSARSRVHEYGGGAWTALSDGRLVFVEKSDQRVWALTPGGDPVALTPPEADVRFGGLLAQADAVMAIREHGTRRDIVTIPTDGSAAQDASAITSVASGSDFLAQPALSPDGKRLAWVAWNHPHMPWDVTELRVGDLRDGRVTSWQTIAGGAASAPLQPVWTQGGELLYVDDVDGWWNLRRWTPEAGPAPLSPASADTGGALWALGLRWFAVVGESIVSARTVGADRVALVANDGRAELMDGPVRSEMTVADGNADAALITGVSADGVPGLWVFRPGPVPTWEAIAGGQSPWDDRWRPTPRELTIAGRHGEIHAYVFAPRNPDVHAPSTPPPYVVFVHGGPTGHVGGAATAKITYLTSRGIGVLDVNYGGSTGYGRTYRERLRGQWGVVDVDDVVDAVGELIRLGLADPYRVAIAGGSAGGWTVLSALARTEVFSAGISRYGVGDARALVASSPDFESRYLDGLIGPLPDAGALYRERSPLSHADGFDVPMLLLQGEEDHVVPPAQAEAIRDALVAHAIPHRLVRYPGEGHGFRSAETIIDALETELGFLGAVWGFTPHGSPVVELTTTD